MTAHQSSVRTIIQGVFVLTFLFPLVFNITIKDANFHDVYSGPGGKVDKLFQNTANIKKTSPYYSTSTFIITATTNPEYMYVIVQEVFSSPKVRVISGDSVAPVLRGTAASGYFFDSSTYLLEMPELVIYYDCQSEGVSIIEIEINTTLIHNVKGVSESNNETIRFYLHKECYNPGFREGFMISKKENTLGDVVKHGIVQSIWSLESDLYLYKNPVNIPEDEHVSTFYISISNPDYGNQYYSKPIVTTGDNSTLSIKMRGSAQDGGIADSSLPDDIVLLYTCLDQGVTEVIIEISLGFYGKIAFGFSKDCRKSEVIAEVIGQSNEPQESGLINIGTSRDNYADIVERNVVSPLWREEDPIMEIDGDEISTLFYISTVSGKVQPFLKPVVSISPPSAFTYTLTGAAREGGTATGNPQRLIINYICEHVSVADVVVSFKLPGFDTVEFGFTKKCKTLVRHTDHVWTANQVFFAMLAAIVAVSAVLFFLRHTKSNNRNNQNRSVKQSQV